METSLQLTDREAGFFSGELRLLLPNDRLLSSALPMTELEMDMDVPRLLMPTEPALPPPGPGAGAGAGTEPPLPSSVSGADSASSSGGMVPITSSMPFMSSAMCASPSPWILDMTFSFPGAQTARQSTMRASWIRWELPSEEEGDLTTLLHDGSGNDEVERGWWGKGSGYERSWR